MYVCTYGRMYVCMYVRACVRTYVRTYVGMSVCGYVCMSVCLYVFMDGWMDACMHACMHTHRWRLYDWWDFQKLKGTLRGHQTCCSAGDIYELQCLFPATSRYPDPAFWKVVTIGLRLLDCGDEWWFRVLLKVHTRCQIAVGCADGSEVPSRCWCDHGSGSGSVVGPPPTNGRGVFVHVWSFCVGIYSILSVRRCASGSFFYLFSSFLSRFIYSGGVFLGWVVFFFGGVGGV